MKTLARGVSLPAIAVMVLIALPLRLSAQTSALSISVAETGVTVSGVTPGEDVVLFSCAKLRRIDVGTQLDTEGRVLRDSDEDGVVTLDGPVPLRSVWIAVDQKSGATATGARPDMPLRVRALAPSLFRKDAEEQLAAVEVRNPRLYLLLVRPGLGAWLMKGRDGVDNDADSEPNGRLKLAFENAQPVVEGKEKAPKHLKAGDVVAAVDPGHLDIFIGQVTK